MDLDRERRDLFRAIMGVGLRDDVILFIPVEHREGSYAFMHRTASSTGSTRTMYLKSIFQTIYILMPSR